MTTSQQLQLVYPSLAATTVDAQHAKEARLGKRAAAATDTLAPAPKQAKLTALGTRAALPQPKKQTPDYLKIMAEAFASAYTAMVKNEQARTVDLTKLQQLDQTMADLVLKKTNIAITKEKKELEKAQKIQWEMKEYQEHSSFLSDLMLGLGIALTVVTVISALFDAGASLALVPEEIAADGAAAGGEAAGEAAAEAGGEAGGEAADGAVSGADAVAEESFEMEADVAEGSEDIEGAQNAAKEAGDTTKAEGGLQKYARLWQTFREGTKVGKTTSRLLKIATAGAFASPMVMNAIAQFKIAGYKEGLATSQKAIGKEFATTKLYGAYLQWYQQLVGRSSGITQDLAQELGNTIEVAGNTINGYAQIARGMGQSRRA